MTTLATAVSDHRGLRIDLADRIRGCGEFSAALAERVGELVADVEQSFLVVVKKITEGNGNLASMLLPGQSVRCLRLALVISTMVLRPSVGCAYRSKPLVKLF